MTVKNPRATNQVFSFKDRRVALTLKRMAKERLSRPQHNHGQGTSFETMRSVGDHVHYPARKFSPLRGYLVVPQERIPGAKRIRAMETCIDDSGTSHQFIRQKLLLGSGLCCIHRRDSNEYAESWEENQTGSNLLTKVQRDGDCNPVPIRVYNFCPEAITPSGDCENVDCDDVVLFVVQDMWGDLYIVKECQFPCSSSSSSSSSASSSKSSSSASSSKSSSSGSSKSSSGSSDSSDSSESDSLSASSTSESESFSVSDSGGCDFTGTVTVGKGNLHRVGDYVFEDTQVLTYEGGALCSVADGPQSSAYLCCDESSSGGDPPSEDPPPSGDPPGSGGGGGPCGTVRVRIPADMVEQLDECPSGCCLGDIILTVPCVPCGSSSGSSTSTSEGSAPSFSQSGSGGSGGSGGGSTSTSEGEGSAGSGGQSGGPPGSGDPPGSTSGGWDYGSPSCSDEGLGVAFTADHQVDDQVLVSWDGTCICCGLEVTVEVFRDGELIGSYPNEDCVGDVFTGQHLDTTGGPGTFEYTVKVSAPGCPAYTADPQEVEVPAGP